MKMTVSNDNMEHLRFLIKCLEGQIKTYEDEQDRLLQVAEDAAISLHSMKMSIKRSEEYLKKWRIMADE